MNVILFRRRDEPTDAQIKAGNYPKRQVSWRGLDIAVENEAGTMRRGTARDGTTWETRMPFPYGYIRRTTGADGEQVDCYLGPDMDAPVVYIVRQRRHGNWKEYDEDKAMIGFCSEDDARAAFLQAYDDPRFLGPVDAMPAEDFVAKVSGGTGMVKSMILLFGTPPAA